mmetsp:Transcript_2114/g.9609  ORF Transcript_2114/g.9609 Transcript_2114/m.9609 type:complete len:264 (+) Transcript_2114:1490-2281(+)
MISCSVASACSAIRIPSSLSSPSVLSPPPGSACLIRTPTKTIHLCTSSLGSSSPPFSDSHGTRKSATDATPSSFMNCLRHSWSGPDSKARSASRVSSRTSSSSGWPYSTSGSSTSIANVITSPNGLPSSSKPPGHDILNGGPGFFSFAFFLISSSVPSRSASSTCRFQSSSALAIFQATVPSVGSGTPLMKLLSRASTAPAFPAASQLLGECSHSPRSRRSAWNVSALVGGSISSDSLPASSLFRCLSATGLLLKVTSRIIGT